MKGLAKKAKEMGVCIPGFQRILSSDDKAGLLRYYIENLDFCLSHDFPDKEYLKAQGAGLLGGEGIYIDQDVVLSGVERSVLLGNCTGWILADGYDCPEVYVKHGANIGVIAKDHSIVRIDCFDDSIVNVEASGKAHVVVNVYGNALVKVKGQGVKVVKKNKKNYYL